MDDSTKGAIKTALIIISVILLFGLAALWIYNQFLADRHSTLGELNPGNIDKYEDTDIRVDPDKDKSDYDNDDSIGAPEDNLSGSETDILKPTLVRYSTDEVTISIGFDEPNPYTEYMPFNINIEGAYDTQFGIICGLDYGNFTLPQDTPNFFDAEEIDQDENVLYIVPGRTGFFSTKYKDNSSRFFGWTAGSDASLDGTKLGKTNITISVIGMASYHFYGVFDLTIEPNESGEYTFTSLVEHSEDMAAEISQKAIEIIANPEYTYGIPFNTSKVFVTTTDQLWFTRNVDITSGGYLSNSDISSLDKPLYACIVNMPDGSGCGVVYFSNAGALISYCIVDQNPFL